MGRSIVAVRSNLCVQLALGGRPGRYIRRVVPPSCMPCMVCTVAKRGGDGDLTWRVPPLGIRRPSSVTSVPYALAPSSWAKTPLGIGAPEVMGAGDLIG